MSGQLFIISAPSGGGKTSLIEALTRKDEKLNVSVSHTTRLARPGESDGVDYFYIGETEFQKLVNQNAFVEHATVFNHHYGTSWDSLRSILAQGKDAILEIDWQGARLIRTQMACVSIFILPPTRETLLSRLMSRAQDSQEVITSRMNLAVKEMQHYTEYDYVVINDDFQTALDEIHAVITASRLQTVLQTARHPQLIASLIAS